ncbi:MAG: BadF/BadG/BcrA/BcrD ATPase family protein [Pseudomonadota bacterium]
MVEFLFGVDGGGTSTRAVVARADGCVLGRGTAGPSALGQGVAQAWRNIELACRRALDEARLPQPGWEHCALGAGLSGAVGSGSRDSFLAADIGFAHIVLESDSHALLLGAHAGRPGAILIAGTGSVAEALAPDGERRIVGGWGFPVGDEGSGAWLGLNAMRLAQAALDGRVTPGPLARHVWGACGRTREQLLRWCAGAGQGRYAQLAPAVFQHEAQDRAAADLLDRAVNALEALALAVDPSGKLPLAVSGSVGERLAPRLSATVRRRVTQPLQPADVGALMLLQHALADLPEEAL